MHQFFVANEFARESNIFQCTKWLIQSTSHKHTQLHIEVTKKMQTASAHRWASTKSNILGRAQNKLNAGDFPQFASCVWLYLCDCVSLRGFISIKREIENHWHCNRAK